MNVQLYDTHAHLDDKKLFPDLEDVLHRAKDAGVVRINTVGCDWRSSLMSVRIAEKHPDLVRAIVGVHPSEIMDWQDDLLTRLAELTKSSLVVGWGEIGLDYHYEDGAPHDRQKEIFRLQIAAAKEVRLPIIIHDRDAHQDTVDILKQEKAGIYGGVLHCFSGSWEMAKECLRLGFYISFAGPLTYTNARVSAEVAAKVPEDKLLIETDCPYLSPHPMRGKVNEPARVTYTAARLAEIRGLSYERITEITSANARDLFGR